MNKIKAISLSLALLFTTGSASAAPERGGYAGMDLGTSKLVAVDTAEKFEDTNIRAFLGYQLNQYFAVEGGLSVMPFEDWLTDVADLTGMDVSVLAKLPITSRVSAYARLGYWGWDLSVPIGGAYYDIGGDSDMLFGIGMEYKISQRFNLRLDAIRYEIGETEIDAISGSVVYNF